MRKIKLLFTTAVLLLAGGISVSAQTDVTSTYLTNPSFEKDGAITASNGSLTISGWTQSDPGNQYNNTGCYNATTNLPTQGTVTVTPSDGDYLLYFRKGWAQTAYTFTTSEAKSLPVGVYTLSVDYKMVEGYDNKQNNNSSVSISAKNGDITLGTQTGNTKSNVSGSNAYSYLSTAAWSTVTANFTLEEATNTTFVITLQAGGQRRTDFVIDNVKLTWSDPAAAAKAAWDEAKAAAETAIVNADYTNVTGSEKTALQNEIDKAEPTTSDGYNTATEALNNAVTAFTAAKTNYDSYAAEVTIATNVGVISFPATPTTAAEALEAVNTLKVAEYNYVVGKYDTDGSALFIPSWEKTNFDALSNEHWSAKTSEYFDKWSGSAFTSKIYKTVTLPEGHYAFYAAARGQAGASTATLKVSYGETNLSVPYNIKGNRGYGINTSGTADFSSSSTYACNNEGFGWEWRFITFDLAAETEVTLSIEGTGKNSWVSAGDTKLLTYDNIAVTRQNYEAALTAAQAYQTVDMFTEDKNALNTVITNNTLTVNTATKDELTTATENLNAAKDKAIVDAAHYATYSTAVSTIAGGTNVDMTSFIVNPSFESNFDGWTNTGSMVTQTNTSFGKTGSKYVEYWQPNGTKGVSQTISVLPAGIYQVTVRAKARGVTSAKVFANSTEQAITIEDKENDYTVTIEIADKSAINIGFEGVGTGAGDSWLALDNFTLKYIGTIDDLTYTLATGKMDPDKSAAQTAAETTFLGAKNLANYNALLTAIAAAEASVANYAKLKAAIDKANDVVTKNNFVTAAAATALQDEIDAATTAWTNVTYTDAQATAEIATLGTAVSGWHAIDDSGKAGAFMASTWGKTHENWFNAPYINTWSVEGDNDGSGFSVPFFEYYDEANKNLAANTFTATLTGLANGAYEVEIWARVQRRSDADFNGDNSMITMSVNSGDAVSIMSNTSNNVGSGTNVMRLGRYKAYGQVTDGTLTLSINVKLGANVHWLSWRDVKYTKIADVAIDEASDYTPVASDYANVTLTRTFSNTNWNTFVVPFDIDNATLAAEFGTVAVAEYSETAEGDNSTINFNMMATPAITANVPVLLKTSTAPASVTFNGVQIKTGDAKVAGTNYDFVGTYAASATVDADDYFIGSNKLWKSTGATTIKGTRAYIKAKTAAARIAGFTIDGEETTAINGITISKDNAPIYNLNGQRVAKPAKGMYVKNGKKVVMK